MLRPLIIALSLSAAPAVAEEYIADAFGLMLPGAEPDSRALWSGLQISADGRETMQQPQAPDAILSFAGPKSMVAGKDEGHLVAIILDKYGNMVADGTEASLRVDQDRIATVTRAGIADHLFLPTPIARTLILGATSGDRQSARALQRVVPDIDSIAPTLVTPPSDGIPYETFFDMATGPLTDRFGNPAEDGTAVQIMLDHGADGTSQITATALDGRAEGRFLSRDFAGLAPATATVGANGSASTATRIQTPTPAGTPSIVVTALPGIAALQITLGPFLSDEGHVLGDGAAVRVAVRRQDGTSLEAFDWARDGYATVLLPIPTTDDIAELSVTSPLGTMDLTGQWQDGTRLEVME